MDILFFEWSLYSDFTVTFLGCFLSLQVLSMVRVNKQTASCSESPYLSLSLSCTTLLTDSFPYFQPVSSQTLQPNSPLTSFGSSRTSTCSWTVLRKTSVPEIPHQESCASPPCTSHIKLVLNVVLKAL